MMATTSQPRTGSCEEVTSRPLLFQLWSAGPKTKGRKNSSSVSSSKCSFINEKKFIAEESGSHFRGPQLEEDWRPSNLKLLAQSVSAQMSKQLRTSTEQQCFCPRLTSVQVPTTCAPRTLVSDTFFQAWQPLKQHQELHRLGRPHRAGETKKTEHSQMLRDVCHLVTTGIHPHWLHGPTLVLWGRDAQRGYKAM